MFTRGIYQGDPLSGLLFCLCLNPLSNTKRYWTNLYEKACYEGFGHNDCHFVSQIKIHKYHAYFIRMLQNFHSKIFTLHWAGVRLWYLGQASTVKWVSYFPLKCPLESQPPRGHLRSSSLGSVLEESEDLLLTRGLRKAIGPLGPTFLLERLSESKEITTFHTLRSIL